MAKKLTATQENYLLAAYELEQENRVARVGEIAQAMAVGLSSVSAALKLLARKGLLNYSPHNYITLTKSGIAESRRLIVRRQALLVFLRDILGLPAELAERNAVLMKATLDEKVYERLLAFSEFIHQCPRAGDDWLKSFRDSWLDRRCSDCHSCLESLSLTHLHDDGSSMGFHEDQ